MAGVGWVKEFDWAHWHLVALVIANNNIPHTGLCQYKLTAPGQEIFSLC